MLPFWKLLGFFLYVALYFWVLEPYDRWPTSDIRSLVFKILPIMHLIFVIISTSCEEQYLSKPYNYRKLITIGLIFSCIGDGTLIWKNELLPFGILSFGVAHVCYLSAFRFQPLGHKPLATIFAIIAVASYLIITEPVKDIVLKILLGIYISLISTMAWRSNVQLACDYSVDNIAGSIGSIFFMISDLCLSIDLFRGGFSYAPTVIMVTYYAAQLFIALSACNSFTHPNSNSSNKKTN